MQTFQGAPSQAAGYEGELQTAYAGVDTWLSERWLAGVAAARSRGFGNWRGRIARFSGDNADGRAFLCAVVRWDDVGVGDGGRRLGRGEERAPERPKGREPPGPVAGASSSCGGGWAPWAAVPSWACGPTRRGPS